MSTKIQVNGTTTNTSSTSTSSPNPPTTNAIYDPSLHSQITTAMLQSGGVKRIQEVLRQRLDEAGWTQAVREYVIALFRSGEATTYDEARGRVYAAMKGGSGTGTEGLVPDLVIPTSVKVEGAEVVRKEVERVCVLVEK